jgi:hypothetical protein
MRTIMPRRRTKQIGVVLFALSAVWAAGCRQADRSASVPVPDGPVVAAVMREDGFLVPFAEYAEARWSGPPSGVAFEPPPAADRPQAWFADRLDTLARWRLLTPLRLADLKADPVPVQVTGEPVEVETHCQRAWALPTDLPGTPTPEFTVHRNVGVALSMGARPLRVAELDASADGVDKALAFLTPYFNAAEVREVERRTREGSYDERSTGAAAASAPLDVTMLYRVGGNQGVSYYFFQASRTYMPPADSPAAGCDQVTVMTGWMSEDPGGTFVLLSSGVVMTNCLGGGGPLVQPMAGVELDGRLYVLAVERHDEGESYSIFVLSPASAERVLEVYGGGC